MLIAGLLAGMALTMPGAMSGGECPAPFQQTGTCDDCGGGGGWTMGDCGWTQPLRDSNGKFGVLTLARSQGAITADELTKKLPMMQLPLRGLLGCGESLKICWAKNKDTTLAPPEIECYQCPEHQN